MKPAKQGAAAKPTPRRSRAVSANAAVGLLGADSSTPVTAAALASAKARLGSMPRFWGRYFKGPGNQDPSQYQRSLEAGLLRRNDIRVVPVARQTPLVGGSIAEGRRDGLRNGAAVLAGFGARHLSRMKKGVLVFLDVEPEHSLSREYFAGWSEGLIAAGGIAMSTDALLAVPEVRFLPGVYMKPSKDPKSLDELVKAVDDGAACHGVWISRQHVVGCDRIRDWNATFVIPRGLPPSIPVWLTQCDDRLRGSRLRHGEPRPRGRMLERLVLPAKEDVP